MGALHRRALVSCVRNSGRSSLRSRFDAQDRQRPAVVWWRDQPPDRLEQRLRFSMRRLPCPCTPYPERTAHMVFDPPASWPGWPAAPRPGVPTP